MDKSTPNYVTPAQACQIWAELLPNPPQTGLALITRSSRQTGPPSHVIHNKDRDRNTPPAQTMYDPAEVREWCLSQQPAPVQAAIAALEFLRCPTVDGLVALAALGPVANVDPVLHEAIYKSCARTPCGHEPTSVAVKVPRVLADQSRAVGAVLDTTWERYVILALRDALRKAGKLPPEWEMSLDEITAVGRAIGGAQ